MFRKFLATGAVSLALTACAHSYKNTQDHPSGLYKNRYTIHEIEKGIYNIDVISGALPWESFKKPRRAFLTVAKEICGEEYEVISTEESSFSAIPSMGEFAYIKSRVDSYVRCADSSFSSEEAKNLIGELKHKTN